MPVWEVQHPGRIYIHAELPFVDMYTIHDEAPAKYNSNTGEKLEAEYLKNLKHDTL